MTETNCLLKIGNSEDFLKFLHLCVDNLIGKQEISFNNHSSDIEWTNEELKQAQLLIQTNFKNNILKNGGNFEFSFDNVGENIKNIIRKCYDVRKDEIRQYVKRENLLAKNVPLVENIDWKLKWVMGSSSLATISEPLLQVDLHCAISDKTMRENINFEMNLEQVEQLINDLEKIKKEFA